MATHQGAYEDEESWERLGSALYPPKPEVKKNTKPRRRKYKTKPTDQVEVEEPPQRSEATVKFEELVEELEDKMDEILDLMGEILPRLRSKKAGEKRKEE